MLFNSFQFLFFFIVVFSLYLCLNHKHQNRMLLVASYIFYGSWDWRFLSLLIISTLLDYFCGLKIENEVCPRKRKRYLTLSVCGNLAILGFFKYFNFFIGSMTGLLGLFDIHVNPFHLNVLLPIGISFYTFQTMSYSLDIYRGRLKPTRNRGRPNSACGSYRHTSSR